MELRWTKSRYSYRRIASESYRRDSSKTQKLSLVLTEPAFVVPRFESRDWRSFVQHLFHVELRKWLARVDRVR